MSQTPYNMGTSMPGGAYGKPPYAPTQPKKTSTGCIVGVVVGVLGIVCLSCCGIGIAVMMYSMNAIASEIQYAIEDSPEIRQQIGEIESFSANYTRSGAEDDDDVFVYDIEGSHGKGYVRVKHFTNDNLDEEIVWAELVTSDGKRYPLTIDQDDLPLEMEAGPRAAGAENEGPGMGGPSMGGPSMGGPGADLRRNQQSPQRIRTAPRLRQ